jgi:hypothetical protein
MKALIFTDMAGYFGWGRAAGAYRIASEFRVRGEEVKVIDCFCSYTLDQIKQIILDNRTSKTEWIGFSTTFLINLEKNYVLDYDNNFINHRVKTAEFKDDATATSLSQVDQWDLFAWLKAKGLRVVLGGYRVNGEAEFATGSDDPNVTSMWGLAETQFFGDDFNFTNSQIHFTEDDYINENEDLPIEIARGCIFKCKFCFFPLNGKKLWEFVKSPEVIREEMMRNYINHGTTGYMVSDDTYNDSPEKIHELLKMYRTLPFDNKFSTYARLDLMIAKPETQEMLYESGMRSVFFGIETLKHSAGKIVGKGMDPEKVKKGLLEFRKKYPDVLVYVSMIGGLPTENLEEMEESFQFLTKEAKVHNVTWSPLFINSGSDMSMHSEKYGYNKSGNDKRTWTRADGLSSIDVREWCVEKKKEYQGHPGGWTFYNRLRNIGYRGKELMDLNFAQNTKDIIHKTDAARANYMAKVL